MLKNTLFALFSAALIGLAGASVYFAGSVLAEKGAVRSEMLLEEYRKGEDYSYLLQAALTYPQESTLQKLISASLERGSYETAEIINRFFVKDPTFDLRIAESAAENRDDRRLEKYLDRLDGENRSEISLFLALAEGSFPEKAPEEPQTNLGKITEMIVRRNFDLYRLEAGIGREIALIRDRHPREKEQVLAVASLFNRRDFPHISLFLAQRELLSVECVTGFYHEIILSYEKLGDEARALESTEELLSCDPANEEALRRAIRYHEEAGQTVEADYYRRRLRLIKSIE